MKKIICKICVYLICSMTTPSMLYAYDDWGSWDDYYDGGWLDEVTCNGDSGYDDNYDSYYSWDDYWDFWMGSDDNYDYGDYDDDYYDDYDDINNSSNNNSNSSSGDSNPEFPTSKETPPKEGCAVWCIKQILESLGIKYTSDQMINEAAKALNTSPNVLKILLDVNGLADSEIKKLYDYFFNYTYVTNRNDMNKAVDQDKYVIAIIDKGSTPNERKGHDVVILDYKNNTDGTYTYTYYDPMTNNIQTGNSNDFYNDGYIINKKK